MIGRIESVDVYNQDLAVNRNRGKVEVRGGGLRGAIEKFSESSRRRLLFICRNSGIYIESQTVLTYHNIIPSDGITVKKQLHTFLTRLKQIYENIMYIWVLEFQERGAPHIHFFSNIEKNPENSLRIGKLWNKITKESAMHLLFHTDARNMIKWNMKSGSYLAKEYLSKKKQKLVPKNFENVGRFWGVSRNMQPRAEKLYLCYEDCENLLEKNIKKGINYLTKRYEKELKKYGIKKIYRNRLQSYKLPAKANMFLRLIEVGL